MVMLSGFQKRRLLEQVEGRIEQPPQSFSQRVGMNIRRRISAAVRSRRQPQEARAVRSGVRRTLKYAKRLQTPPKGAKAAMAKRMAMLRKIKEMRMQARFARMRQIMMQRRGQASAQQPQQYSQPRFSTWGGPNETGRPTILSPPSAYGRRPVGF